MADTNVDGNPLEKVVVGVYQVKIGKSDYRSLNFVVQRAGAVTQYTPETGKAFPDGLVAALRGVPIGALSYDVRGIPTPAITGEMKVRYQSLSVAEQELLAAKLGSTRGSDVDDVAAEFVAKVKDKATEVYHSPTGKTVRSVGRLGARVTAKGLRRLGAVIEDLGKKSKE
ncbi:MAG: hypothetical protein Q7R96_01520 [Nanoarchaeota archaeon]|nr:hypothetical protein [Nanoarchaeota archaeon]